MQRPENRPLISFCMITYGQERFVKEAVEGALAQTYSPLEIIFSDDCSPDRTFEIIQEMVANYRGPHKIILNRNKKNMGLCPHVSYVARELFHGEWMAIAAGDDVSLPDRVADFYRELEKHPDAAIAYSGVEGIDADGNRNGYVFDKRKSVEEALPYLASGPLGCGASAIYRKDIFSAFPAMGDFVGAEDMVLASRALLLGNFFYVENVGVLYRRHGNNLSISSEDKHVDLQKGFDSLRSIIGTNIQQLADLFYYEKNHPEKFMQIQKMRNTFLRSMQEKKLRTDWFFHPEHRAFLFRHMIFYPLFYQLFFQKMIKKISRVLKKT